MTTPHRINGWLEAAIAWNVCASIHERFAKRKDALYTTRHKDFVARAKAARKKARAERAEACLLYTSPSPRDGLLSRMPSSA